MHAPFHSSKTTQYQEWILFNAGVCEARLYRLTGVANGEGAPLAKRVAAYDLHEAIAYMRKWHSDLDIQRVELVTLIEILSGSPLN